MSLVEPVAGVRTPGHGGQYAPAARVPRQALDGVETLRRGRVRSATMWPADPDDLGLLGPRLGQEGMAWTAGHLAFPL